MTGLDKATPTVLAKCDSYDVDRLEHILREMLGSLGMSDAFRGKRVAVKPNLVMKKSAEAAATTHPAVLEATLRILKESAAEIVIAESPPGLYTEAALRGFYSACGISEVAERCEVALNSDFSTREVELIGARTLKRTSLISPLLDCDVIVNLAKLKSHALTRYSGAVKNFYGAIPGLDKVELHARFADYYEFGSMLVDLCGHFATKPVFSLLDGILAMEGNGPTGGEPRALGALVGGFNPFNVDVVGAQLGGFEGVIMLDEAKSRGYTGEISELTLLGESVESLKCADFVKPDSVSSIDMMNGIFGGRLKSWLAPRPVVLHETCIACGACARSCPKNAIEFRTKSGKNAACIDRKICIRCFCCQELCPVKAVVIKKNPILKLAKF